MPSGISFGLSWLPDMTFNSLEPDLGPHRAAALLCRRPRLLVLALRGELLFRATETNITAITAITSTTTNITTTAHIGQKQIQDHSNVRKILPNTAPCLPSYRGSWEVLVVGGP